MQSYKKKWNEKILFYFDVESLFSRRNVPLPDCAISYKTPYTRRAIPLRNFSNKNTISCCLRHMHDAFLRWSYDMICEKRLVWYAYGSAEKLSLRVTETINYSKIQGRPTDFHSCFHLLAVQPPATLCLLEACVRVYQSICLSICPSVRLFASNCASLTLYRANASRSNQCRP